MAGPFYPPPPPFLGGRQPYAPQDRVPPSGPLPQPLYSPISVQQLALIIASWQPPQQQPPPLTQLVPPAPPVAVPQLPADIGNILVRSWNDDVWTTIYVGGWTASGPHPPPTTIPQFARLLAQAWDIPFQYPQVTAPIAHQLPPPSQPTPVSATIFNQIIALNQPPFYAIPTAGIIASTLPSPSQPPPTSWALLNEIVQLNQPLPWWPLPSLYVYPTSGPPPLPPQPFNFALLGQLIQANQPLPWWPLPSLAVYPHSGLPTLLLLPNVTGYQYLQAVQILQFYGFNVVTEATTYDVVNAPGVVLQQTPVGNQYYLANTPVFLIVSAGPFVPGAPPLPPLKVTLRQFSLEELASREWGPSFRAPDHRIYQFSSGRGFDSTDTGYTGIYQPGVENPVIPQPLPPKK